MAESTIHTIDRAPNPIGDIFWPDGTENATPSSVTACVAAIVEVAGDPYYLEGATELGIINATRAARDMLTSDDPSVTAAASARRVVFELNTNLFSLVPQNPEAEIDEEAAA